MADAANKEWQSRASALSSKNLKDLERPLGNSMITSPFGPILSNHVATSFIKRGILVNLTRWFKYIEEAFPDKVLLPERLPKGAKGEEKEKGGNFDIGLQNPEKGVVTRFPPEPSGYLHIGHAKAALLNDYFAHEKYSGTLLLRFDDTNPSKEKEEFQDSIVEDLELMGIKADKRSHTSDYFQELYEYCVQMLKEGTAYADDTAQEVMRNERMNGLPSKRRDTTPEENLARFEEMTKGTEDGTKWCIRAKISVDNPNKAMRDPVIYRCNPQAHHRTGSKWKVYPTYDFCCPIVDSIEGVTHALRTTEYKDRDAQYQWFITALRLRPVYNWDFNRLNFVRTLLSKRKLTKFVDSGVVWGWDDPRMPTVRGVRRRGMTVKALREFILSQGPSKNIVNLDWTTFWAINKKEIDPIAGRYTALDKENIVTVTVVGAREAPYSEDKPLHAKNDIGTKKVWYSQEILIGQEDAASFKENEEITLMNWGNAIVKSVKHSINPLNNKLVTGLELELHLQGDVRKTEKKITWLSTAQKLTAVSLVDFDYLITKDKLEEDDNWEDFINPKTEYRTEAVADENVAALTVDSIIQFDRKGFYRIDKAFLHGEPAVAFKIPTGKEKK